MFPILKDGLVYLDSAATTQKPQRVIDRINKYYSEENANVHRGIYTLSEVATIAYEDSRDKVASFIGCSSEEVIFTKGTTESLNLLTKCLELQEGDEVVLSVMEHHSNLVPWQQLTKKGIVVKFIPLKGFELDMEAAAKLITSKTRIVSIVHMSNVLGVINDIQRLADLVHFNGGLLIVDGAQSIAHMPINVKDLDCDFFAFSAHKMYGPTGVGVLYGRKELLNGMEPFMFGGDMIKEVKLSGSTWNDLPHKFEAGTPNIAGVIGLGEAVDYLSELGMEKVMKDEEELVTYFLSKLPVSGVKLIGPISGRGGVFSFTVEGIHPHDVSEIMNSFNIAVRAGHHCAMPLMKELGVNGTTRVSFGIYTTKEDVDKFFSALEKVKEVFNGS